MYKSAVRVAAARETRSKKRLERISLLRSPRMQTLYELPEEYLKMYRKSSSLPPLDEKLSVVTQTSEPGKRQWETGRSGYTRWAVGQLLTKAGEGESWGVGSVVESAYGVGTSGDVKTLLDAESMDITS
jgi:kinetochore protein Mis12/MTW1